ncbi:hypothetical protein QQ054_24595 [Oscillatoria amoena NRMC-F 0135]|jgi:hypothetical protein|nr:hypothetical protein [Oscillatoria amoena NRMC-F 0135]
MAKFITGVLVTLSFFVDAQIGSKVQQQSGVHGIWTNNQFGYQMTLMLNKDGSGEFDGAPMKYTLSGSTLSLTMDGATTRYTYAQQGNSLTLSGGDIDGNIIFSRQGSGTDGAPSQPVKASNLPAVQQGNAMSAPSNGSIVGTWSGNGETIEFKDNGQCLYMGQSMAYQLSGNNVVLQTAQGQVLLAYSLNGNQLTISGGGLSYTYSRGNGNAGGGLAASSPGTGKGRVAPELVGKWCWTNVTSTNTGGTTSERCITLNADGTYQYASERSSSVNTNAYYGGTNAQSGDQGTWSYDGARIYYNSRMGQGTGSYALEKRNHPRNGDPMIVLDGEPYVTYYQKPRW